MQRWIMHIDMDAFFASVEQLDNPELRGKPVAVGGTSDRGVISAASYEIRKFGVRSAMSVVKARQLCPHGIFVPGRMRRYKELSRQVMAVLHDFSPLVEQASVDEAYVDATGSERLFGPVEDMGRAIKLRVAEETGLTCSVGAAPLRFLAKIASDLDKPDGLSIIRPEQVRDFLQSLDIRKIPGVGKTTHAALKRLGVYRAGDMLSHPREYWEQRLGKSGGILFDKASGIDPAGVQPSEGAKSCSAENTFDRDLSDRESLRTWLLGQSERVGEDLRRHGYKGRTVTLKVKFSDFSQITRSHSLDAPTCETAVIFETAVRLLGKVNLHRAVRLIGVGVSNFNARPRQLSLLDEPVPEASPQLDEAVDAIRQRFGRKALARADLLGFGRK